jgi:hypothetical protein
VEPNGQIWLAHFSDGTEAALRLPETYPVVSGEGTLRGESVAMMSISPVAFAIWQLTGSSEKPLEERFKEAPAEMWVAEADCNSILASNTGKGLPEALLLGAQAVNQLLQEFHAEHGIYPVTLEQLVRGTRAIASRAPGNAYVWPEPLTDDLRPKSALAPGLVYLGFGEERDGIVQNTGYALGVIGPGAAAEVPAAVAARFASPPAEVIKWFVGGENPAPLN